MKARRRTVLGAAVCVAVMGVGLSAQAQEVLNLYSSRHYQTDEALYENFTKETGIEVNRIEGKGDALIERIKSEGANSPADVFLTVDAGRLWRADQAGLFQPIDSAALVANVPASLRHPEGHWFGFSTRARVIYYDKAKVQAGEITSYEDLADPKWKGRICIRSSSNIYNQSLMSSIIAAHGEEAAQDWAEAIVGNLARNPVGGDTDQIRAIGAGECDVAVANTYYFVRLMINPSDKDKGLADKIGWVFPNQGDRGTHVNVSGAGVLKHAPHKEAAVKFLEYLASPAAQRYFADGNNEYPVVSDVEPTPALKSLGDFKSDSLNVAVYGENQPKAQRIFDSIGWN
ncbi:Fe(3+) ABC transporter substrate-binding protein [Pelagibius litoralis]|uniref:Fe(3+) ABC transporter substrate-binding protein n=1 Tax=Pelagibius litoralis TaxID=374515 RepID=A0A967EY07_9PROT|nr:Fe(3+) ABC transporter substrate-binding protein [Pelagibius litoralis]NIA69501.1 Fe(3+) ABC transporter substrate-binding protein [Pelagibius litoralis]